MIARKSLGLALLCWLAVGCAAEEEAPPYSTITGSVQADSGEAVSGATVRLEIDRKLKTTTTRADGSFELALDQGEYEALPENFFVVVEHAGFAANAIELRASDDEEEEITSLEQELGTTSKPLAEEGAKPKRVQAPRRVVLTPEETVAASRYTVTSRLAHLGNSEYEGAANSRFQLSQASGESISYTFELANFDASRFTRAAVRLYARGVESENEIVVNGALAGAMPLTPANGTADLVAVEVSPTAFVAGENELQISAALADYTDVDDFEYAFVEVVFYTAATVEDVANDLSTCSTEGVDGLTRQIIEQLTCISGASLAELDQEQLVLERTAYRWAQPALRDALTNVLATRPERTMTLNSTLRSVAQQYLLFRQLKAQRCGRKKVNDPGTSTHEVGLALDVAKWSSWKPALEENDFKWAGQTDPVHFTYVGPGTEVLKAQSIKAFQKLWSAANPSDTLVDDGDLGPQTEERLKKSPAAGFPGISGCL